MTGNIIRVVTAGAALLITAALATGCGDDSTASAPTSSVTTESSPLSTTSSATSSPSTSPATSTRASSDGQPDDTQGLPETGPPSANVPEGADENDKTENYLKELEKQGVAFPNDPDNAIALSAASAVCQGKEQGASPADIKIIVVPLVGSGTTDEAAAQANADKVIKAAESKYC
jgi:hypothetical protein